MNKIEHNVFLVLLLMVFSFGFAGQAFADTSFDWVYQIPALKIENSHLDSNGYTYLIGYFNGTVDFDPSVATSELTAAVGQDGFIMKVDADGDFVWVKQFKAASSNARPSKVFLDASDNIYLSGFFQGTVDFDPGAGTANLASAGGEDGFVTKLDSSGDFLWAKQIAGAADVIITDEVVDDSSNVYISGYFSGTVDFNPGAGTANLTSAGGTDLFVLKLDTNGDYLWANQLAGAGSDYTITVALDSNNNVYSSGTFSGTVDFDPGAGVANLTSAGSQDIFMTKFDTDGALLWAKQIGEIGQDEPSNIFIDANDYIYLTGFFHATVDFDTGAGTEELTSVQYEDIFVLKVNADGDFVWVKQFGGSGEQKGQNISVDALGNVYSAGYFYDTADFDPGVGTANLTTTGERDMYISKLDSSGDFVWVEHIGAPSDDQDSLSISNDGNGGIYLLNLSWEDVDIDPGVAEVTLDSSNGYYYLLKLIESSAPTVSTAAASDITTTTVTLNGEITNTGNVDNTERGFNIGLDTNYTMTDISETGSYSTGTFSLATTGLVCATTYHYRAYSTNTEGTSTGSDTTFTTSDCPVVVTSTPGGAVPVWILQAMSDTMRQQNNQPQTPNIPTQPQTPACNPGDIYNSNTRQKCPTINTEQTNTESTNTKFNTNLQYGMTHPDVKRLQQFLNNNGYTVSNTGPGSINKETTYFGLATRNALIKYQKANNIKPAIGFFGPITRGVVNK